MAFDANKMWREEQTWFFFLLFIIPLVFLSPSLLSPAFLSSPFSVLNRFQIYLTWKISSRDYYQNSKHICSFSDEFWLHRQTDMCNKLKLLRTEDGWCLPHFTYSVVASSPLYIPALWHLTHCKYQRCGIFPTVHTNVVALFPSYLTALWHLTHCTYQRCGIIPILPTSVVASSPLYIPTLWHHSHLTYQRCGIFPTVYTNVVASFPS